MSVSIAEFYGGASVHQVTDNFQLVLQNRRVKFITPINVGVRGYLPNATRLPLRPGGPIFILRNLSTYRPFCLYDWEGGEIGYIPVNSWSRVFLIDASTAAGTWVVSSCDAGGSDFTLSSEVSCSTSTTWSDTTTTTTTTTTTPPPGTTTTTVFTTTTTDGGGTGTTSTTTTTSGGGGGTIIDLPQNCLGGVDLFQPVLNLFGVNQNKGTLGIATAPPTTTCHPFDSSLEFNPVGMPVAVGNLGSNVGREDIRSLLVSDANAAAAVSPVNRILGLREDGSSSFSTVPVAFALKGIGYYREIEKFKPRGGAPDANLIVRF